MDAKSKDNTVETVDSGLAPSTIPGGCNNAQNGVSVENMPEEKEGYKWYVFRASYGREEKAAHLFGNLNADCYVARHTVYVKSKSGVKSVIKSLLPNFVFAYLAEEDAKLYTKGYKANLETFNEKTPKQQRDIAELTTIISFYYNHFAHEEGKTDPPLTVPYQQMKDFIIATYTKKDVMPVDERQFEIGEEVEVAIGEFSGLRGRVIRKLPGKKKLYVQLHENTPVGQEGKSRLLFQLPCLGSFCSALIPTAYFRKIEN